VRTLLQDLRYAARLSFEKPGSTLIAVLTLAVGVAATTTVFSWIDATLLRPIRGVADPARLVSFESLAPDGRPITTSYLDFRDYRDHLKLVSLVVFRPSSFSLGTDDHPVRAFGELVSGNYFAVMGVRPELGRAFSPDEYGDSEGAYPVAVIGHGLWQTVFNSDPRIVGRTIQVNRQPITVVGVAPPEFHGSLSGLAAQIWIPAMMSTKLGATPDWMLQDRHSRIFAGIARLAPGATLAQARSEAAAMASQLSKANPDVDLGIGAALFPMWQGHFGAQSIMLAPLEILMAVCCVVLLIVCANVANLQLARAMGRQQEFTIRMAVGAGRGRVIRQLLTESLLLSALGCVAGALLASWAAQSIGYLVPPTNLPIAMTVDVNADVLIFTALVGLVACLLSGIAPAFHAARANLNDVLKEGGRGGTAGAGSHRIRALLVVGEVALAMVAIVSAGLFARSFEEARKLNPGLDPNGVAVAHLPLSTAGYSVADRSLFCRKLRDRLEQQPGVYAASYADSVPQGFDYGSWEELQAEGYVPSRRENMNVYRNVISPGYFKLLRIPLLQGRDFTDQDDISHQPVMIVSQSFVRKYFPGRDAIGRRVHGWGRWFTVVGVVADSKYHTPNEAPEPYFYVAFRQTYRADLAIAFYVRAGTAEQAITVLRREARALDPGLDLYDAMPLRDFIQASLFPQKIGAALLAVLGAVALVLAAIGLYSVMAYSISQRTHEIGIRMALGARPADVRRMMVRQGMRMAATGLIAGIVAALALTRVAAGLLVKISPADPVVFAGATLFLCCVALVASYVPARRATRIDPNQALREI
jgi:predicted permease